MTCYRCKYFTEEMPQLAYDKHMKLVFPNDGWCIHPDRKRHGINGHPGKYPFHQAYSGNWCFQEERKDYEQETML